MNPDYTKGLKGKQLEKIGYGLNLSKTESLYVNAPMILRKILMDTDQPEVKAFLTELYTQTGGDLDAQASMQDIATALGIDDGQAGSITESLYIQGLAEMKSLSGGMGITVQGLKAIDIRPPAGSPGFYSLPDKKVLEKEDIDHIVNALNDIKKGATRLSDDHDDLEQYVLDMKCIEFHLASPKPKTEIIRQLMKSMNEVFDKNKIQQVSDSITALIS